MEIKLYSCTFKEINYIIRVESVRGLIEKFVQFSIISLSNVLLHIIGIIAFDQPRNLHSVWICNSDLMLIRFNCNLANLTILWLFVIYIIAIHQLLRLFENFFFFTENNIVIIPQSSYSLDYFPFFKNEKYHEWSTIYHCWRYTIKWNWMELKPSNEKKLHELFHHEWRSR